jgi:hypothetical protein
MKNPKTEWREIAEELFDCLLRSNIDCGELSHRKNEYHDWAEECPVVKKVNSTIEKYKELCKTH